MDEMEEIDNGIRIIHSWLGYEQVVEATYENDRLTLKIDDQEVCLNPFETGYFLAYMASWYDRSGD